MGDGDKLLKSPKGKGVINRIGDVLSPRNLKLKMKGKSVVGNDEQQQQEVKEVSPTATGRNNIDGFTGIATKEQEDDSDNKSADIQFFYEGKDSAEFSSPFTNQFNDH